MNIFFDTEFTGLHKDTTLISIGLIAENGRTFYAEFVDYSRVQIDDWIQRNVIDNLKFKELGSFLNTRDGNVEAKGTKQYISKYLKEWLESFDQPIQLVSDVCHYDMVLFIDLFGSAFDLPKNVSPVCHDLNQDIATHYTCGDDYSAFDASREQLLGYEVDGDKHNSLYDAKVIKYLYDKIKSDVW